MNERIEQLMLEVGTTGSKQVWFTRKEVLEIVIRAVRESARMAGEAEYSDTWKAPIEDRIKEHFGVKDDV